MVFIFITVFIDVLGIGIIVPILPELIKEFTGGSTARAGRWFGVLAATYAVTQFFFAPILGSLSDRVGRRPVILISLFGLGIDYIIMGLAPSIGWLFAGRLIAGVMGASITTANAYVADVSEPEKRDAFSWLKANPIGSLFVLRSYPLVAGLAVSFVFMILAQRGLETVWVLYTGHKFGWDELANGLSLALVGLMAALVQGVLVQPVIKRTGERRAILGGLALAVITYLGYGLATQGWMLIAFIIFGSIGGVAGPALQSLVAGAVEPQDQGKVQGGLQSLMSLTSILSPLIFTSLLFSYFTSPAAPVELPGAPFLLGAVMYATAFVLVLRLFRRIPAGKSVGMHD